MNQNLLKILFWLNLLFFTTAFGICIMSGWKMTAWFGVFPLGLAFSTIIRSKKNSN